MDYHYYDSDPDYNPSRKSLIRNKWVATTTSIWIQCTSGSLYTFSIYSALLKSSQGYDQSTLGTLSVFKDFGANVGILAGLLYTAAQRNGIGPWVVHLAGAIQCFAGYFVVWLAVVGRIDRPHAAVVGACMVLVGQSSTYFNTANVVTGVNNFGNYGGTIIGIMKGFLGLSGAILVQVYQTIFKNKPSSYLLLLSLLPTLISLLLMPFVRNYKTTEEGERKYLNGFSVVALLLAAYLTSIIIIQHILNLKLIVRALTFALLMFLIVSPMFVAIKAERDRSYRLVKSLIEHNEYTDDEEHEEEDEEEEDNSSIEEVGQGYSSLSAGGPSQISESNDASSASRRRLRNPDLNLLQALRTLNFWFLFYTTLCALGSGLTIVNNIAQIGESLGYTTLGTNTLVSLWSIWNFLGRFGAGYVSDYLLHLKGFPRPLFMASALLIMTIGHLTIAFAFPGALYVGSVLLGICYGSQWSLMPATCNELFGTLHFGTIFNTISVAGPVGSYLLSVRVLGFLYDRQVSEEGGESCVGDRCFRLAFVIMACVTLSGVFVAMLLWFRTRKYYRRVVRRRVFSKVSVTAE